jgi:hypothetical protein
MLLAVLGWSLPRVFTSIATAWVAAERDASIGKNILDNSTGMGLLWTHEPGTQDSSTGYCSFL